MKRVTTVVLCSLLVLPLLTACNMFASDDADNETRVLRIATLYGDERNSGIRSDFTEFYEFSHDNIEIEVVNAINYEDMYWNYQTEESEVINPVEEMKKLIESTNPPDVLILDYTSLPALIEENLLQPLDAFIVEEGFDTDGYADIVLEALRDAGNGQLYGLSPTFSSYALIYNADLFHEVGVPLPYDGMTWDEVFELAKRFAGQGSEEDPIFGFSFSTNIYSDFNEFLNIYTEPLHLKVVDENMERMLVNTPQWEEVFTEISKLYEEDVIPNDEDWWKIRENIEKTRSFSQLDYHAFLSGKVAMALTSHDELGEVIYAMDHADVIEGFDAFAWDVVALPYHEENPNVGGNVTIDPIFVIPTNATNTEDAWDFIKFINSEQWAQLKSKSTYTLLSREEYNEPLYGAQYNMNAFFQTKPVTESLFNNRMYYLYDKLWNVRYMGQWKFEQVVRGELTVKEALEQWENEGNQQLQNIEESEGGSGVVYF